MTITQSFYDFVKADATLTAITTQIYPGFVPQQGVFPAVTFSVGDDLNDRILTGIGCTNTASMDVDCWAESLVVAESLATALKNLLIDYAGPFQGLTVSNISKSRELHLEENDTGLRRVSLQFEILYGA